MKGFKSAIVAALALSFLGTGLVQAAETKRHAGTAKEAPATMSPEQKTMMDAMMKYSMPNENHKTLDMFVGRWKNTVRMQMTPDAKPEVSMGTNTGKWIMGKRFLQQDYKGMSMGKPFEGMGLTGYDNIKKEYSTLWIDNMATGMMTGKATFDTVAKTFTESGSMSCPMTGETNRWYRAVGKVADNDHYTYEMFMKDKDGKEFRSMEITYERIKQPTVSHR